MPLKVEGADKVIAAIKKKEVSAFKDGGPEIVGIVGFTAAYAIYVHENLEAHHITGQAKFLEAPAKRLGPELSKIVARAIRQGKSIKQAILLACLRLQREAQQLTPVETGALRASAYIDIETQ